MQPALSKHAIYFKQIKVSYSVSQETVIPGMQMHDNVTFESWSWREGTHLELH